MECLQDPSADKYDLTSKLDGMNRLSNYLKVDQIHDFVDMSLYHLGMYDTAKIAVILAHLIWNREYVVRETSTRNLRTGKTKSSDGPRIRDFRVAAVAPNR